MAEAGARQIPVKAREVESVLVRASGCSGTPIGLLVGRWRTRPRWAGDDCWFAWLGRGGYGLFGSDHLALAGSDGCKAGRRVSAL